MFVIVFRFAARILRGNVESFNVFGAESSACDAEVNEVFKQQKSRTMIVSPTFEEDSAFAFTGFVTLFACLFAIMY